MNCSKIGGKVVVRWRRGGFYWAIMLSLGCVLNSCQQTEVQPGISTEKFVQIYADYVVAVNTTPDQPVTVVLDTVLTRHQITRDDFKNCFQFYIKEPKRWEDFLQQVIQQLEARLDSRYPQNIEYKHLPADSLEP